MPSKRIIILEVQSDIAFRAAMWVDVPVARQPFYADPAKTSAYRAATAGELSDLRSGAVVERVVSMSLREGRTVNEIRQDLEATWTSFQAEVTAANPWVRYGQRWAGDGSAWVPGGVS